MDINLTMLGEALTFAIFVLFTMRFVWPPLTAAMRERQTQIAEGLAAARRGEESLEKAKSDAAVVLTDARAKAAEIIDNANKRAAQIVDEAKGHAREEGQRLLNAAQSEIEQEALQAKESLRKEVAKIAVLGAEKILQKAIDGKAHEEMLAKLAANM